MASRARGSAGLAAGLVGEALRALEREDFTQLSLRDLARRLSVSEAAPYHHFKNKQDLEAAVIGEGFRRKRDDLAAAVGDCDHGAFGRFARGYIEFALANRNLFELMHRSPMVRDPRWPDLNRASEDALQILANVLLARCPTAAERNFREKLLAVWIQVHGLAQVVSTDFLHLGENAAADAASVIALYDRGLETLLLA